jgi:hypothetical protein
LSHLKPDRASHDRHRRLRSSGWRAPPSSSVELTTHGAAVEPRRLELAHDHADVLLAEVLLAMTGNRDDDTGFMAKTPMARGLAAEFSKPVLR